jgi:hypothetical protein
MKMKMRVSERDIEAIRCTKRECDIHNVHVVDERREAIEGLCGGSLAECYSALQTLGADPRTMNRIMLLRNNLGPSLLAAVVELQLLVGDEPLEFDVGAATVKISVKMHDSESDQEE